MITHARLTDGVRSPQISRWSMFYRRQTRISISRIICFRPRMGPKLPQETPPSASTVHGGGRAVVRASLSSVAHARRFIRHALALAPPRWRDSPLDLPVPRNVWQQVEAEVARRGGRPPAWIIASTTRRVNGRSARMAQAVPTESPGRRHIAMWSTPDWTIGVPIHAVVILLPRSRSYVGVKAACSDSIRRRNGREANCHTFRASPAPRSGTAVATARIVPGTGPGRQRRYGVSAASSPRFGAFRQGARAQSSTSCRRSNSRLERMCATALDDSSRGRSVSSATQSRNLDRRSHADVGDTTTNGGDAERPAVGGRARFAVYDHEGVGEACRPGAVVIRPP